MADNATRDLPAHYAQGVKFNVCIDVAPPPGTFAQGIEDGPPAGWTDIGNVCCNGSYDEVNGEVKWAYWDGLPRVLCYEVTPPGDATGEQCFLGRVYFNGFREPTGGDECLTPGSIKGDSDGDGNADLTDYAVFVGCMAGPETPPDPAAPLTAQECLDIFDVDEDGDVDLSDAGRFQSAFRTCSCD